MENAAKLEKVVLTFDDGEVQEIIKKDHSAIHVVAIGEGADGKFIRLVTAGIGKDVVKGMVEAFKRLDERGQMIFMLEVSGIMGNCD